MTDEGYLVYPGSQQAEVQGYIRYCRLLRRIVHGKKVLLIFFLPVEKSSHNESWIQFLCDLYGHIGI